MNNLCLVAAVLSFAVAYGYEPTWESLDTRPLPAWYDQSKFGIFIHWGVFAVPSFGTAQSSPAWMWWFINGKPNPDIVDFIKKNYPPGFEYPDFAPQFSASLYDPEEWANIFASSGAKYVVLTSKHHEGYTNWPSKNSWNWNSMDVGPKRDLVGELANAIKNKTSLHFGLYHSLYEWFNPLYLKDKQNNYTTQYFIQAKTMPELYDIVMSYKPDIVWSDGQWEANSKYWNSTDFLAWLYNESPVKDTVVTNDRWGSDTLCKHGGFLTCTDRYNPGQLQTRKWENAMTIDGRSWGFNRNSDLSQYLSVEQLIQDLVTTVSCNGNLLLNVGPTSDGKIPAIFQDRLKSMGEWLGVNGEGIYGSRPWKHQNDSITLGVWYTQNQGKVYAFVFSWPSSGVVTLGRPVPVSQTPTVDFLGGANSLTWVPIKSSGISIMLPVVNFSTFKAKWVYVFRLNGFN